MSRVMRKPNLTGLVSNAEWKHWGDADPLWAVASWPGRERSGCDPWTDEEFYKLGECDWREFVRRWQRYGLDQASCVEIGCGAGRITMHLAGFFGAVYALDVSEGMLEYARSRIIGAKFILTDGVHIPLPNDSVTAAFSCHVFQHFDSMEASVKVIGEIVRVLRPGATIMIHLPLYNWPLSRGLFERLFMLRQWLSRKKAALYRLRGKPLMRGTWYEIGWLVQMLGEQGLATLSLLLFRFLLIARYIHSFLLEGPLWWRQFKAIRHDLSV